ncbi:MAG: hypothetical protein P1U32_02825 [Legionellaceae bacterium]|nr:hypothetical protein [Legionellaceae bacterium]
MTFKKGEKITFIAEPSSLFSLNSLEFRVFFLSVEDKVWNEVITWQGWPLPPLTYDTAGNSAIQVDVRQKDSSFTPQQIFLGNFFIQNEAVVRDNFLAEVMAHHRNPETSFDKLEKAVAKELKLGIYLLYWDYLGLSLQDTIDRARQLDIGVVRDHFLELTTEDNVTLVTDLRAHTMTDSVVTLCVRSKLHIGLQVVLAQLEGLPEAVKIAAVTTYFLHHHFNYSQVTERFKRPFLGLKDTNSMCNLTALLLQHLLTASGYDVNALTFAFSEKIDGVAQVMGSHAMNEIYYDGQYYVLDATTNRIGEATDESVLDTKRYPTFIVFPQLFSLDVMYQYEITEITQVPDVETDRL